MCFGRKGGFKRSAGVFTKVIELPLIIIMKRCPECRRDYVDDTLSFCLEDGAELVQGSVPASQISGDEPATAILSEPGAIATGFRSDDDKTGPQIHSTKATAIMDTGAEADLRTNAGPATSEPGAVATGFLPNDEPATAILHSTAAPGEAPTRAQINTAGQTAIFPLTEAEPQKSLGDSTEKHSFSANRAAKPLVIVGIAVVLLVGGFFGYRYFAPTKQIESIAVMPFVNESGNADVEYLSDGMTETLIRSLSQLANLQVKPRSSVFRYKGKETDAKVIGKELNVQAILNGRVIQRGDQLTLNLELIDVQKDVVLWSEQYNRKQSDIVSLQSEIAKDVSNKLKSKLSGADEAKVTKASTTSPEAYQAYLKGRYYWNRRTAENLKKAIEQFRAATDSDSNYALAYAGLADCYVLLNPYAGTPVSETLPLAKHYAERAIVIDDQLAEPHASLGQVNAQSWQWAKAEREYKQAIELNPNYATAYQWYCELLKALGRFHEATSMIKRAHELDPLSSIISLNISIMYQMQNDDKASIENSLKLIEIDPNFSKAYDFLGMSYLRTGREQEAIANLEKAVELSSRDGYPLMDLGYGYAVVGKLSEAKLIARELEEKNARNETPGECVAGVYAGLGQKDKAFEWLEKDFQAKRETSEIRFLIAFESLRDDPRYNDLLKRMGLLQ